MTEITDLNDTDSSNTSVSTYSVDGNIANMSTVDNVFQSVLGLLARTIGRTNIASAGTTNLGSVPGSAPIVSGNATITSLGTLKAGTVKHVTFTGTPTLTYNATSLILPTAANIVVAAGDTAVFVSEGSGNWRCVSYQRASGRGLTDQPDRSNDTSNLAIVATAASNALTIAVKGHNGADPSAANPVYIPFRSATAGSGDVDVITLTSAASLVVSNGSTLGTSNATPANLVVVGFNDSGTFRLGVINSPSALITDGLASSTAEGGAGAADNSGVFYTGTAVTSKAYTVIGFVSVTQATAGTWATAPSLVQTSSAPTALTISAPFTKSFVSAPQTLTGGGSLSLAHGLGVKPSVEVSLQCAVAVSGYTVGDELLVPPFNDNGAAILGVAVVPDATNIFIRFSPTATWVILNKTTGARDASMVTTNWRLIVRAWA